MAIAHICLGCGWDLARVRPVPDPRYALPLIVCPRCQKATTRARHPIWIAFRKFRRLDLTITALGIQIAMAILLTIFTPFSSLAMVVGINGAQRGAYDSDLWWYYFWPLAVIGPLTGAWLTAGFPHITRWRAFLGWYAYLCLIVLIGWFWVAVETGINLRFMAIGADSQHWPVLIMATVGYLAHVAMMGAVMVTAIAGIPLGWGVQSLLRNARSALWRRRRRRLRLRSSA